MNKHDEEKAFLNAVSKDLDQGVDCIDESTRDALRNIRKKTIAEAADKSWHSLQLYPTLATTVALALVVSLTLNIYMTSSINDLPELEDLPLMSASDDIDFYQDLEFYQWLEAQKVNG